MGINNNRTDESLPRREGHQQEPKYRVQTAPQDGGGLRRSRSSLVTNPMSPKNKTLVPIPSGLCPKIGMSNGEKLEGDEKESGEGGEKEKVSTLCKFQAGPLCGSKTLNRTARREVLVPVSMSKLMIFVVDMTTCRLIDGEARQVVEMKEDIQDALGIFTESGRMQVIFSGYDGPRRHEIHNDADLNTFFSKFGVLAPISKGEEDATRKKHEKVEVDEFNQRKIEEDAKNVGMTAAALKKMRLGNCITKIQMRKYLRQFGDALKKITELEVDQFDAKLIMDALTKEHDQLVAEHEELKTKHEDVVASIPWQIDVAVAKAVNEVREKMRAAAEIERKRVDKEHRMEMTQQLGQLQKEKKQAVAKVEGDMRRIVSKITAEKEELQAQLEAVKKKYEAQSLELCESKKEAQKLANNLRSAQAEMEAFREEMCGKLSSMDEERQKKLAMLEQQYENCRVQLEECIRALEDNGIPVPGRVMKQESTLFRWHMARMEQKFGNYVKEHAVQSPEFTLWGLKGLQLEFFPSGLQGSYEGWSSLKLRIPQLHAVEGKTYRVSLHWKVMVGDDMVVGPRRDEFCGNYWWCQKGTVQWKNFAFRQDLIKYIDDKDCLDFHIEIIDATVEMVKLEKPVATRQTGAGMRALAEHLQIKSSTDADLLISYKGKLVEDGALIDLVMGYIKGNNLQSCLTTNIRASPPGSIMWDAGDMSPASPSSVAGCSPTGMFNPPRSPSRLPPHARNAALLTRSSSAHGSGPLRTANNASAFSLLRSSGDNRAVTANTNWRNSDLDKRQGGASMKADFRHCRLSDIISHV